MQTRSVRCGHHDDVAVDVERSGLSGNGGRQTDHAGLRGSIVRTLLTAAQRIAGADVYDAPAVLLAHIGECRADGRKCAV